MHQARQKYHPTRQSILIISPRVYGLHRPIRTIAQLGISIRTYMLCSYTLLWFSCCSAELVASHICIWPTYFAINIYIYISQIFKWCTLDFAERW